MRYRDLLNACLPPDNTPTVRAGFEKTLREKLHFDDTTVTRIAEQFAYLDFFSERHFSRDQASAAQLLLDILQEKWQLAAGDRDLVVMQHRFEYQLNGASKVKTSALVLEGENDYHTAMAKTVGLPLAMALRRYLVGEISLTGVQIPIQSEIYNPVLAELEDWGVKFIHK
jgi:saccharopine dehydrogenase-like NADP-dependent oxidoreductase